jgi:hypothetical protein
MIHMSIYREEEPTLRSNSMHSQHWYTITPTECLQSPPATGNKRHPCAMNRVYPLDYLGYILL